MPDEIKLRIKQYPHTVAVTFDDVQLTAVYKPQRGERPLWDFPDGTLCMRETAAFLTSRELGWEIVPPTDYFLFNVLRYGKEVYSMSAEELKKAEGGGPDPS